MHRHVMFALFSLAICAPQAAAHFIWLEWKPGDGGTARAELYFSEEPEPGEPHLIGKAAGTKVWLRRPDGSQDPIKVAAADDDVAALVGACAGGASASLEGTFDYGVYQRGAAGLLLQYYAKGLPDDWPHQPALVRSDKLKLDIVPALADGKLVVQVLYGGQPVVEDEIVFVDPAGEHIDLKTDAEGRARVDAVAGRWAVRTAHIEAEAAGQRDGKKFQQTWHQATLVLNLPSGEPAIEGELPALDALTRARSGRAVWHDFPGFAADLTVHSGSEQVAGRVEIDADGIVTLVMPKSPVADWVEEQLNSLVQHRMPDGEISEGDVSYADGDVTHPLGRKIDLGDPSLESAYRIKDDVIMEVNRSMGPLRFTISVLEIERNAENKYLPRSFTMNFFDSRSGELKTSLGYWNGWQRVGAFDLPIRIIEIDARKGGATTKEIVLSNLRLMDTR